jgi:hypothetical protein
LDLEEVAIIVRRIDVTISVPQELLTDEFDFSRSKASCLDSGEAPRSYKSGRVQLGLQPITNKPHCVSWRRENHMISQC